MLLGFSNFPPLHVINSPIYFYLAYWPLQPDVLWFSNIIPANLALSFYPECGVNHQLFPEPQLISVSSMKPSFLSDQCKSFSVFSTIICIFSLYCNSFIVLHVHLTISLLNSVFLSFCFIDTNCTPNSVQLPCECVASITRNGQAGGFRLYIIDLVPYHGLCCCHLILKYPMVTHSFCFYIERAAYINVSNYYPSQKIHPSVY